MSTPEGWGVTRGHTELMQHKEATSSQEMKHVLEMQKKVKSSAWTRRSEKTNAPTSFIDQQERDEEERVTAFPVQFRD